MNTKIILSIVVIGAVAAMAIGGTVAYFSDTETSTGNTFTAGTLDLQMKVGDEATGTFNLTNIRPSQILDPITLKFTNVGSVEGWLNLNISLTEADATYTGEFSKTVNAGWDMTADEFAKLIYVTALTQEDTAVPGGPWNILPGLITGGADTNGDGKLSLYELKTMTNGKVLPDSLFTLTQKTITLVITFHLGDTFDGVVLSDPESPASWAAYKTSPPTPAYKIASVGTWNVPQADGVGVNITATLSQRTSW